MTTTFLKTASFLQIVVEAYRLDRYDNSSLPSPMPSGYKL